MWPASDQRERECGNPVPARAAPRSGPQAPAAVGALELRLSRPGDQFLALDADELLDVPPGEVSYAAGQTILTRHFVWRQARTGLIGPATREVFLVSEVLGEVGREVAEAVLAAFRDGLQEYFGVAAQTFLVDAQHRGIEW